MKEYFHLFSTFAKIGAVTLGGGLAMIPIIRNEVVSKNKWIDDDEFMDIFAISQSLPGLLAVNISIFLGYKIKGVKGSIVATLGSVLPSFLIILAIAMVFTNFKDNETVNAIFKGIRPVVVALIAVPTIQLAVKNRLNVWTGSLALATILLITFLKISPVYILLIVGVGAFGYAKYKEKKK